MIVRLDRRQYTFVVTAFLSALLSLWKAMSDDIINNDGVLYLQVARTFLDEGVFAAAEVFQWPFYGILIGLTHELTGLGLENSALTLNTILACVTCVVFVKVYEEVSGSDGRLWVAAVLVLVLPILNDYREEIIRGHGFWAFMLVSLYYFIKYSKMSRLEDAIKWQLALAVAILFRFEGIVFLLLAPLYYLLGSRAVRESAAHILRLNVLYLLGFLVFAVVIITSKGTLLRADTSLPTHFTYMSFMSPSVLLGSLNNEAAYLYDRMWQLSSVGEARLILVAGMLALVVVKVAGNIGLPFLLIWLYGCNKRWLRLNSESIIVICFAAIGMLTLVGLATNRFFLSSRYTVLTVLFISLITFQYVDYLLRDAITRRAFKLLAIMCCVILALFLDAVVSFGAGKENIKLAGNWVLMEMGRDVRIACNETRLVYYSNEKCNLEDFNEAEPVEKRLSDLKKDGYAYFLLWVHRKNIPLKTALSEDGSLVLIKAFLNKKGDSVSLYRIDSR